MKQRKLVVALAVILVLVLAIGVLTACKKEEKIPYEAIDDNDIVQDLTYGVDYKTLYDQFGNEAKRLVMAKSMNLDLTFCRWQWYTNPKTKANT